MAISAPRGSLMSLGWGRGEARDSDSAGPPLGEALVRELFRDHWVGLCRLAGLILGDHAAAEEVVQEAFMRSCAGNRLEGMERADLYLRTAVVNLCRSRIRRRVVEARVNAVSFRRSETETVEATRTEPDEARRVAAAVRALPDRQRAAVVLRYYEDMAEADIALALGCSVGTVKSQLAKARRSLGRALADHGEQSRFDD